MLVDLVEVTAEDGVRLHGALETPPGDAAPAHSHIDAWLCLHGTGSNFYSASTLAALAPKLLALGAAVLRANTRGHDLVATGPSAHGRSLQGAAFERVDESPHDVRAWIDLLHARGFARVGILGHSLGAIKAIYTLAGDNPPRVAALVAVSPPRLSYAYFCQSEKADEFGRTFDEASRLATSGHGAQLMLVRFPLPYYVTAAGYVDRYGPEERYDVLRLLDHVGCPTLVTYGTTEMQADLAFRGMSDAVAALAGKAGSIQVAVIAGADHLYTGVHDMLARRIERWLAGIGQV